MDNKKEVEELFEKFVGSPGEEKLATPFIAEGFYGATDKSILLLLPVSHIELGIKERENVPNIKNHITFEHTHHDTFNISQALNMLKTEYIDEIIYRGQDIVCDECGGSGEVEWSYTADSGREYNMEDDCPVCKGSGYEDQAKGKKTGKKIPNPLQRVRLLGTAFSMKYINLLSQVCKVAKTDLVTKVMGSDRVCAFEVGPFTVLICPVILEPFEQCQDITPTTHKI